MLKQNNNYTRKWQNCWKCHHRMSTTSLSRCICLLCGIGEILNSLDNNDGWALSLESVFIWKCQGQIHLFNLYFKDWPSCMTGINWQRWHFHLDTTLWLIKWFLWLPYLYLHTKGQRSKKDNAGHCQKKNLDKETLLLLAV